MTVLLGQSAGKRECHVQDTGRPAGGACLRGGLPLLLLLLCALCGGALSSCSFLLLLCLFSFSLLFLLGAGKIAVSCTRKKCKG